MRVGRCPAGRAGAQARPSAHARVRRAGGAGAGRAPRAVQSARALAMARWLLSALVALLALSGAQARKSPAPGPSPAAHKQHEPQIEEVTAKQLERVLEDKDFVAVYWCKWPVGAPRPRLAAGQHGAAVRGRPPPCRNVADVVQMGYPRVNDLRPAGGNAGSGPIFRGSARVMQPGREDNKIRPGGRPPRRARHRGLKWYRVSFSIVPPLPLLPQGRAPTLSASCGCVPLK